jgi:sulfatase maturation enzyme AslB (radical SAM superfamily)
MGESMRVAYDVEELRRLRDGPGVQHPRFGDLLRPGSVRMGPAPVIAQTYGERSPYFVHLSVTGRCNARCVGCVNSSVTDTEAFATMPETDPERDARAILHLLDGRPERDVVVCYYGGEPLLRMDKIQSVMSFLDQAGGPFRFQHLIYTNAMLLDRAIEQYPEMVKRASLFCVSVDGTAAQNNRVRPGTDLDVIHRNLGALANFGRGNVLAWSTLRESQSLADCLDEYAWLDREGLADCYFWHWVETGESFESLDRFMAAYERDLRRAMNWYVARLGEGRPLAFVHITELLLYLLTGKERGSSACGVEKARNFDIAGGVVHSCADLPPEFAIGRIEPDGTPVVREADLKSLVDYKDDLGCYEWAFMLTAAGVARCRRSQATRNV